MFTDAHGRSGGFHPALSPAVCLIFIALLLSACVTGDDDDGREAATVMEAIASSATATAAPTATTTATSESTSTATATATVTSTAILKQSPTPQPVDESDIFVLGAATFEIENLIERFEADADCVPQGSEIEAGMPEVTVDRSTDPPWTAIVEAQLTLTQPDGQSEQAEIVLEYENVRPNNMSVTLVNAPECPWE